MSSPSTWLFSALSCCGRFSVTKVTAPRRSTRMVSYSAIILSLFRQRRPFLPVGQRREHRVHQLVGDFLWSCRLPARRVVLVDQERAHAFPEIGIVGHVDRERI